MDVSGSAVAHGVDLVDIDRFAKLFRADGAAHLGRYFTSGELTCVGEGLRKEERLAGRYAIKEAVLKAMGTGWGDAIGFRDVEVVNSNLGAPSIVLHRRLAEMAHERGITGWLVSSTHAGAYAIGSVIGVSSRAV